MRRSSSAPFITSPWLCRSLIIGLVLGPLTEVSLRKGLFMTDYALGPFLLRPIAGTILFIAVASVLWNLYSVFIKKGKASMEDAE